jgi:hypothetical protein
VGIAGHWLVGGSQKRMPLLNGSVTDIVSPQGCSSTAGLK